MHDPVTSTGGLSLHRAFCKLALPLAAVPGHWRREAEGLALALETAEPEQVPPHGWCLRLLLIHICDQAVRQASPLVELGADVAALAEAMRVPATAPVAEEITRQLDLLLACKLTLGFDGQAPLSVFDARGRSRKTKPEWPPQLRLNARFHASLMEQQIRLDSRILHVLATEPLAIDAHAWTRQALADAPAGQVVQVPWPELQARYGTPGQSADAFRAAFEEALQMVFAADTSIVLGSDDAGMRLRAATAEDLAPPPEPPPPPPRAVASPRPAEPAAPPPARPADRTPAEEPASSGAGDMVSLRSHLTGLSVVVWLRRGHGAEQVVIGLTPGTRYDPARLTLVILEPLAMQVTGGVPQAEFERVAAWAMANRDLIDQFWEGEIDSFQELTARVKKVPAANWR
ncbi:replication initiation protein [Pseudoroseomonas sp. WGS1072]|uniref:hypothetical protein n=1 Tax=Roseomonas sp. WGS1072 TaxID=3366816 RepID=UPI003BF29A09